MKTAVAMKAGDIIAIVFVALCAVLTFALTLHNGEGRTVEIISNGESRRYPLGENREIKVTSEGVTLAVEIKNGEVRVTESDCPDRECVKCAPISDAGGVIACAPAKTLIKIEGESDADFIAG